MSLRFSYYARDIDFCALEQGTKIVDESHDQDTTDLHKCVSYIRDFTPELDKSNVSEFLSDVLYCC